MRWLHLTLGVLLVVFAAAVLVTAPAGPTLLFPALIGVLGIVLIVVAARGGGGNPA